MRTLHISMRIATAALVGIALAACEPQQVTTTADVTLETSGGSLVAHCALGKAEVVSAAAAAGFTADIVVPGPSNQASVFFVIDGAPDVRATVTCSGGEPRVKEYIRERNDYIFP